MSAGVSERLGALLFDRIPHGIFAVDAEHRITAFNPAAERITGWRAADALGRPCREVFRSDRCDSNCFLQRSMRLGDPVRDQRVVITRKDGTKVPISVSTASLRRTDGREVGGVEMFRDLSEIEELRQRIRGARTTRDIVSRSPAMDRLRSLVDVVANSDCTVLIQGEPGTGKELTARAIHYGGPRAKGPFIAVNCGAIPDSLAESVLFGHVRGAFTDATQDRQGRFALANGGTLLLDEVGDLSPQVQVKLLRVLQEREFSPLGAEDSVKVDVRVIAATNRDLAEEVRLGRFRLDLLYRLDIVRIVVPPLRERLEDVPMLVRHFIERFNSINGPRIRGIDDRAIACMCRYAFPGNVRELENLIEHAYVVCPSDMIRPTDLPLRFQQHVCDDPGGTCCAPPRSLAPLEASEAGAIRETLLLHRGNRTRTAKDLGISRNTLWRKMQRYGIS